MKPATTVPKVLQYALIAILLAAVVTGYFPIISGSSLPLTDLLDVWLVLLAGSALLSGRLECPLALTLMGAYSLTRVIPAVISQVPLAEFLRAYRWLLYIVIMIVLIGRGWSSRGDLVPLTWFLLIAATIKYGIFVAVYGTNSRPILFLENNFEIPLFFGLVIITYSQLGKWRLVAVGLCGIVGLLSQSRSGILAFACVVVFAFLASPGRMRLMRAVLFGLPLGLAGISYVFTSRAEGEVRMDRERFFDIFKADVADWDLGTWLYGTPPITPIDTESCSALRSYAGLVYSLDYDTCYSVIFHSFGMRVVYDAGILGLLLAFGMPLFAMLRAGVDKKVTFALLAIAATNALSVSSLNNPYVALPVILAILHAGAPSQVVPLFDRANRTEFSGDGSVCARTKIGATP